MDELTLKLLNQSQALTKQYQKEADERNKAEAKRLTEFFKSLKHKRA